MSADQKQVIAIAADHGGFEVKQALTAELADLGYRVLDLGTNSPDSVDYPVYAEKLSQALIDGSAGLGVLVCGTGIGISIAANRHPEIRAAVCHNVETARLSRQHNNANVLALGGRVIDQETARACLRVFLETDFESGGRHERRVNMLSPQRDRQTADLLS